MLWGKPALFTKVTDSPLEMVMLEGSNTSAPASEGGQEGRGGEAHARAAPRCRRDAAHDGPAAIAGLQPLRHASAGCHRAIERDLTVVSAHCSTGERGEG